MLPILLAIAFILLLLFILITGQPDEFKVTRTTKIAVPSAAVFPQVNELRKWEAWSPWAKLDPDAKSIFEGPASGIGSAMAWAGNKKIGEGSMTITESRTDELIRIKLEFLKPFKATNTAEFLFKPDGNQTTVTWSMTGTNNFFFKVFSLFMNCDDMAGRDFEKGLAAMKSVAETAVGNN
ncbi:MAG TPA: SRPBCC family protein [Verrucomicrobiae bacterium]|nr:SRPBCC family protein [Verrucomicrobiae bacterium]